MNMSRSHFFVAVFLYLKFTAATLVVSGSLCAGVASGGEDADVGTPTGQSLIDAMANKNPAPEMVEVDVDPTHGWSPLYSTKYDWNEDRRVDAAFAQLAKADDEVLWPLLVANIGDRRYATVWLRDDQYARFNTVGDLCFWIARTDLLRAYYPAAPRSRFNDIPDLPLQLFWKQPEQLVEWWRPRREKPLYELQIEVAELALSKIPELDGNEVSKQRADKFRANVASQIADLRRTKTAVFLHESPLGESLRGFHPVEAANIRKVYEKKKRAEQ
jgi:hypothetical protein